jgi:hypothetical protein
MSHRGRFRACGARSNANFGRITGILPQTERMIRFGGRFLF